MSFVDLFWLLLFPTVTCNCFSIQHITVWSSCHAGSVQERVNSGLASCVGVSYMHSFDQSGAADVSTSSLVQVGSRRFNVSKSL